MNGPSFFVDTNILIYLLSGDKRVAEILQDKNIYCSFITEIELKSSKTFTQRENTIIENILASIHIMDINPEIKAHTVYLRRRYGLKLPDAMIAASAIFIDFPLFTADKTFSKIEETDIYLYSL